MVLWFNTLNIAWLLYFNVIFQMKMNVHSIIFQTICDIKLENIACQIGLKKFSTQCMYILIV